MCLLCCALQRMGIELVEERQALLAAIASAAISGCGAADCSVAPSAAGAEAAAGPSMGPQEQHWWQLQQGPGRPRQQQQQQQQRTPLGPLPQNMFLPSSHVPSDPKITSFFGSSGSGSTTDVETQQGVSAAGAAQPRDRRHAAGASTSGRDGGASTSGRVPRWVPVWHTIPGTAIVVDYFTQASRSLACRSWILTHFHADHYGGLTKGWKQASSCLCIAPWITGGVCAHACGLSSF